MSISVEMRRRQTVFDAVRAIFCLPAVCRVSEEHEEVAAHGDEAGGQPQLLETARDMYRSEAADNGGVVRKDSPASRAMAAAMTLDVRRIQSDEARARGGVYVKGGPTSRAVAAATRKPFKMLSDNLTSG